MTTTTAKPRAAKVIEDATVQAKANIESIVQASQEQAKKHFEQTMAATKDQVEKTSAQVLKGYDEVASFSKQNVEALVEAGSIVAKGVEEIGKEVVAYSQASFDKSVAAGTALLSAKSLREVVDLQNDYAKSSFDAFVAEANRLSELSVKVANEAFAPLSARMNVAVEKLSKPIAA